mmetsp:Transcript_11840/g.26398  ORF Transcript_11840/g.26398 Transcript_11840/m.26398 type:complete len:321 (-) Transcript_11840:122-1084(-)
MQSGTRRAALGDGQHRPRTLAAFVGGALLVARSWYAVPAQGAFVSTVSPLMPRPGHPQAIASASSVTPPSAPSGAAASTMWPVLGVGLALVLAQGSSVPREKTKDASLKVGQCNGGAAAIAASCSTLLSVPTMTTAMAFSDEPRVAMNTAGGRRKRLGLHGGRVCMLTGKRRRRGFFRTYTMTKVKRYWNANIRWNKLWWPREKRWVRLMISMSALKLVDKYGLEAMCKKAGLDLYAWCLPHWEPGSRQPLCVKVGNSPGSKHDKKLWPDYLPKLNRGAPLGDVMGQPEFRPENPFPYEPLDLSTGSPKGRLVVDKVKGS